MKSFMEIGPHVFEKSGRQTDTQTHTHIHTHTDAAALYIEDIPQDKFTETCQRHHNDLHNSHHNGRHSAQNERLIMSKYEATTAVLTISKHITTSREGFCVS